MKKTHWLRNTLLVLIACGIAGTVLAGIQFRQTNGRTCAKATLQFAYDGAGEGKGPNGYPFDVSGISSEEVITAALEASSLADKYTSEQIRENLTVTGVYPENLIKKMMTYTSLLDADADQQAAVLDYHATQYDVILYSDFDPQIPSAQLKGLLGSLLEAYRTYFAKTCSAALDTTDAIADLTEYDYSQQLTVLRETVSQQTRYAEEMQELAPDFRLDGKSFDDLIVRYENLDNDIERMNASISLNALSKDRERLQKQYEMEVRTLNRRLEAQQEELKRVEEQVDAYEKDSIVYVSTSDALQKVAGTSSGTYDRLVIQRKTLTDSITSINAEIVKYEALLADMTANQTTKKTTAKETAEKATAEETDAIEEVSTAVELTEEEIAQLAEATRKQINALISKKNAIAEDFVAMLEAYAAQEVNEKTVSVSRLRVDAPSFFSGAFIKELIKTAAPLCAVGFMVCLVLLILSRRREEKSSQA